MVLPAAPNGVKNSTVISIVPAVGTVSSHEGAITQSELEVAPTLMAVELAAATIIVPSN